MNAEAVLSPRRLARAIGVSESSLKRWVDEGRLVAARTVGGHRRIRLAEAVRFIRQTGLPLVRPDLLGMAEVEQDRQSRGRPRQRDGDLMAPLIEGRSTAVRGMLLGLYLAGRNLGALFDGPVRSAMERIGRLWQHEQRGIFLEHRATDICLDAVRQLRGLLADVGPDRPAAVGGAPEGDPYLLPSLMAATILTDVGFRAVNLGPQTPLDSLLGAVRHHRAPLAWLSFSLSDPPRQLGETVAWLADELAGDDILLVVGGRTAGALNLPERSNIHRLESMTELAAFAQGLTAGRPNTADPPEPTR